MGVFDFVKDAGAKIGIGDSDEEKAETETSAAAAAAAAAKEAAADERARKVQERVKERKAKVSAAESAEILAEAKKAAGLERYVKTLGIEGTGIDIRFDDGVASITGEVADQQTRERLILAVGNAQGVETVNEEIKVANEGAESDMHVVVKGDTLWAIAAEYLGDGNRYPEVFEANRPMLDDPNKIFVGQVLRIPKD